MRDYSKPILDKNGNPLQILFCNQHCCIRVIKQARALRKLGYSVHALANKVAYGSDNSFHTLSIWQSEQQFKDAVKLYIEQGVRIVVWSNEPDIQARWAREVIDSANKQKKVKLVLDWHDCDSVRIGTIPLDERLMVNAVDAVIYVSAPTQAFENKLHSITKPNIQLFSYCNENHLPEPEWHKVDERKGMVYEGGLNIPTHRGGDNTKFKYRDLYPIMKRLVEMGNEVHLYCGNLTAFKTYQDMGAVLYPPTDYDELLKALGKFKFGLVTFNNKDGSENQVNMTLTNKCFEYAHAGVPPIVCWAKESENYVTKHGIGFVFDDLNNIGNLSQITKEQYMEKLETLKVFRKDYVMENFIWKEENLFASLLNLERKSVPEKIQLLNNFECGEQETIRMLPVAK